MSLWQTPSWKSLLLASKQADEVFEVDGLFVEKRSLGLGQYGLFAIGVEYTLTEKNFDSLQKICQQQKCLFIQIETIDYGEDTRIKYEYDKKIGERGTTFTVISNDHVLGSLGEKGREKSVPSQNIQSSTDSSFPPSLRFGRTSHSEGQEPSVIVGFDPTIHTKENRYLGHWVGQYLKKGWKQNYYKKFIPPYTALIDLTKSEENILSLMKPKGRYNIKLAREKGVVVKKEEKTKENIQKYYDIMKETTSRDNFSGNSLQYYTEFLTNISESELFLASYNEEIIAGGIFVFEKEVATYYYGASSNNHRNLMAPYLLQWEAIIEAKKRNTLLYDFLGVATPGEESSPLAGVTDFKSKFTSDIREVSKSLLWVNKRWRYVLLNILRKIRK